jgi:type IV pilus assembly protein PilB
MATTQEKSPLNARRNQGLEELVPRCFAEAHRVFPLSLHRDVLTVAMADVGDAIAAGRLRLITRCELRPVQASDEDIAAAIADFYRR